MADVNGKLILAFFMILIGVIAVGVIATESQDATSFTRANDEILTFTPLNHSTSQGNETLILTNVPTGWMEFDSGNDCWISSFRLKNQTGNGGVNLSSTTDYTLNANNGTLLLLNSSTGALYDIINVSGQNVTYADYSYCATDYLNSGWARTVLRLVAGFFALGVLGSGLWIFYSVAKETNII